jgi:hypothetical protein
MWFRAPRLVRGVAVGVQTSRREGEMSRFFVVPFPERERYAVVLGYEEHRYVWRWVMRWEATAVDADRCALALNEEARVRAEASAAVAEREAAQPSVTVRHVLTAV